MFKGVTLARVAVALILVLLAGCGGSSRRVTAPPVYGHPDELIAWVSATSVEFEIGETVQIEVGVLNPTPHPIRVAFARDCISYVVRDAKGIVFPNSFCLASAIPFEMTPGEVIAAHFTWDGTRPGTPIEPGEFQLDSYGLPVSATPITIRLLAP